MLERRHGTLIQVPTPENFIRRPRIRGLRDLHPSESFERVISYQAMGCICSCIAGVFECIGDALMCIVAAIAGCLEFIIGSIAGFLAAVLDCLTCGCFRARG